VTLLLDEHPSADDLRQIVDGVRNHNRTVGGHVQPRAQRREPYHFRPNLLTCVRMCAVLASFQTETAH
jgi:hypothetical protein